MIRGVRPTVFVALTPTLASVTRVAGIPRATMHAETAPILRNLRQRADLVVLDSVADAKMATTLLEQTGLRSYFKHVIARRDDMQGTMTRVRDLLSHGGGTHDSSSSIYVGYDRRERWMAKVSLGVRACPHLLLAEKALDLVREPADTIAYFSAIFGTRQSLAALKENLRRLPVLPIELHRRDGSTEIHGLAFRSTINELRREGEVVEHFDDIEDCDILDVATGLTGDEADVFARMLAFRYPALPIREGEFRIAVPGDPAIVVPHPPMAPHGHTIARLPFVKLFDVPGPQRPLTAAELDADDGELIKTLITEKDLSAHCLPLFGRAKLEPGDGRLVRSRWGRRPNDGNAAVVAHLVLRLHEIFDGVADVEIVGHEVPTGRESHHVVHGVEVRIGKYNKEGAVVLAAHLDSCVDGAVDNGDQEEIAAPGADDNASGVAGVLMAARALRELVTNARATGRPPVRQMRLVFFNEEENGRLGSLLYCIGLAETIYAMINMDMIGWQDPNRRDHFMIRTFGAKALGDVVEQALGELSIPFGAGRGAEDTTDPMLKRGDHYSFILAQIPACLLSERGVPRRGLPPETYNASYHTVHDTEVDFALATAIARTATAAVWKLVR